ncbi:PTS sugar transporter subunit IIA [Pectinatus sottacetonis]|uniref:PTS sugar transporter subunit IIA n=1 Tax=Pectinatus sottacetonis TaxID=1002795 RepID=UPI0018C699C8|nr:PTS sugar transporter subunit IIA [Pectinatus sottacetonis]
MKGSLIFIKDLLNVDIKAQTQKELFTILANPLLNNNFVTSDYLTGVIEREKKFPTGLPTKPYGVALPHTLPQYVIKNSISVGVLKEPIKFKVMGSENDYIDARIIFLLALNENKKQLWMLQAIMNMIRSEKVLTKIATAKKNDVFECISENLF